MTSQITLPGSRGVELEGWLVSRVGGILRPVEVDGSVVQRLTTVNALPVRYSVARESGEGAIEAVGFPASSLKEAIDNVDQFERRAAEEGLDVVFSCRSPCDASHADTLETPKSRFLAIIAASKEETSRAGRPEDWKRLLLQNGFAATHLHSKYAGMRLDGDDVDVRLLGVANVINNFGPVIADIICSKHGVDNRGHLAIFARWAAPERFSRFGMWYRSFEDMKQQVSRMTRFVRLVSGDKEHGVWEKDLETPLDWAADEDVSTLGLWHLCRLRKKFGTSETRVLPSLAAKVRRSALCDLDAFQNFLVSIIEPRDVEVEGVHEFMSRPIWREITRYAIGSHASIPYGFSRADWDSLVLG